MYYRLTYHNPDYEVIDLDSQRLRQQIAHQVRFFWRFVQVKCPKMLREDLFFAITNMDGQGVEVILTLPDQIKMTDEWLWRVAIEYEWVFDSQIIYRPIDLSHISFESISEYEFLKKLESAQTSLIDVTSYDPLDQECHWIREDVLKSRFGQ